MKIFTSDNIEMDEIKITNCKKLMSAFYDNPKRKNIHVEVSSSKAKIEEASRRIAEASISVAKSSRSIAEASNFIAERKEEAIVETEVKERVEDLTWMMEGNEKLNPVAENKKKASLTKLLICCNSEGT
ncbi:uncharacterized protein LOC126657554 [Mercurialis annua]|uniref:uncharacterized protein LOC126657554 n=1 Tax=Mercurialis annua TaxID=3986 RepID=UPI0024AD50BE|nr:uncharacterized protein LOC126657554 [Mercurialis annua]